MQNETHFLCLINNLRYVVGFERDFKKEFMLGINIFYILYLKGYLHENLSLK